MLFNVNYWIFLSFSLVLFVGFLFFLKIFLKKRQKNQIWKGKLKIKLQNLQSSKIDTPSKIIQLDKLLEYALQNKFNQKNNLGKLLQKNFRKFKKEELKNLWKAHKIRNSLVHDIDLKFNHRQLLEAESILLDYLDKTSFEL